MPAVVPNSSVRNGVASCVTRESSRCVRINVEQQRQKNAVISAETETREQIREEPCIDRGFRISSAVPPTRTMFRPLAMAKAIFAGLMVTLLQLGMAVLLLAPDGPWEYRYQTLVQHDSYWFANIVNRGYQTIVPPISYKVMEVSNTAFFPAYPGLAAALHYGLGLATENALLITAQAAAWGFWTYFFLFCNRWNLPPAWQFFGALGIAAHPAAFFLVAGYSESLFLLALFGFLYWTGEESRWARVLAAVHGMVMSATRIVGLPCAFIPLVRRTWELGWRGVVNARDWFRNYGGALLVSFGAMVGGLAFFVYCQLRFGNWNIYMLTQQFGWGIDPDYSAVFRPSSYHWVVPVLENPTQASQLAMTIGAVMLLALGLLELDGVFRRRSPACDRIAFYFAAAAVFFISVAGVASVGM